MFGSMIVRRLYVAEISVIAIVVLFLPLKISGLLESPSEVTIRTEHGADFLIISWAFHPNVTYYRILLRDPKSSNATDEAGPMEMYCGFSRNTTCSYCIANIHREVSCSTLDKHYTQSIGGELDFEQPVSVKVEPCTDILPEDCLDQGEWINFTIPAGAPSPVLNVHAKPMSSKTVEVTWSAPNQTRGKIVLYSVLYKTEKGREMKMVFGNVTKGILTQLNAKTKYKVWITASTANKEGERSVLATVETYVDECVSGPCKYNGLCQVDGSSFKCVCRGDWDGQTCGDPKDFALKKKRCLDEINYKNSVHSNVSLEFCASQCRSNSSCRSFEYGFGYSSSGRYDKTLHQSQRGQCKLLSTDTTNNKLTLCSYDYYEKRRSAYARSDPFAPSMLFLGTLVLLSLTLK